MTRFLRTELQRRTIAADGLRMIIKYKSNSLKNKQKKTYV